MASVENVGAKKWRAKYRTPDGEPLEDVHEAG